MTEQEYGPRAGVDNGRDIFGLFLQGVIERIAAFAAAPTVHCANREAGHEMREKRCPSRAVANSAVNDDKARALACALDRKAGSILRGNPSERVFGLGRKRDMPRIG
jgi:hypothetical protein